MGGLDAIFFGLVVYERRAYTTIYHIEANIKVNPTLGVVKGFVIMHLVVLEPLNVAHALKYVDVVRSGLLRQASSHGHLQGVVVAVLGGHQLGAICMILHRRDLESALASIGVVDILVGDEIILIIWVELLLQAHVDVLRLVLGALEIMLELILSHSVTR